MSSCRWPLVLLAALLAYAVVGAGAYSSGAPNSKNVCNTLIPGHGSRQNAVSPYKLIHSESTDGQIVVNLVATSQVTFAGFIVQARDATDLERIIDGEFVGSENAQVKSCLTGKSNTWTHSSGQTKTQVSVFWLPPANFNGSVVFKGTVVQVKQAYWDQIKSDSLYYLNGYRVEQRAFVQNYGLNKDQSSSEPLAATATDLDYDTCSGQLCIGLGTSDGNCMTNKKCRTLLAARQEMGITEFLLSSKPSGSHKSKYFSMAFSEDSKMGDDLVVDCLTDSSGNVRVGLSYNHGNSNELLKIPNILRNAIGKYENGIVTCKWSMEKSVTVNGKKYDLVDKKYHLFLAHGDIESDDGEKDIHSLKMRTAESVNLASVGQLASKDLTYLIRIHGSLMVIAWLACVSVAIIFARYFKDAWSSQLLCGVKIWFAFHRTLMILSVTLMVIAQLCIFLYVGGYRFGSHQLLGSVAFTFAILNPLGALFRPHPDASNRWLFNWLHWFGGNVGHITAAAAILLASGLSAAALPKSFLFIVMAWILIHVLMHFIFQFHTSCVNNSKTGDIALNEMHNGERLYTEKRSSSSSGSGFKSFLLAIYILVVFTLTVLLVVMICAPNMIAEKAPFL